MIFIDETWASTKMVRAMGRSPRGQRLRSKRPAKAALCGLTLALRSVRTDSHTHSLQRLEVVTPGRRRRWSEAEKRRIVADSFERQRAVSETARRHGITPSLLYSWRRALAQALDLADTGQAVVPVQIAGLATSSQGSRIEILLVNGVRLLVEETVDPVRLGRLAAALEQR